MDKNLCLGIELGSTRIKAVAIDGDHKSVSSGEYSWKSRFENGIWTYPLEEVWTGLKQAVSGIAHRENVKAVGISGMMHGYLAFDKDWNLLAPFRTWQNTVTAQAAEILTKEFGFNIPQRWSIAHLYQTVLNGEEHIGRVAHITTLAGYVHYMLTGVNAIGVGEASGMFPVDSETCRYDEGMLQKFEKLTQDQPWNIRDLLPGVLIAGVQAGNLTEDGAARIENLLPVGIPFAPAEGDMGTGMTATNAIAPRTGNVSAGTSVNAMVVLERPLKQVHPEIDLVTTPAGKTVAMVHCNNCTNDMNAWVGILREAVELFGGQVSANELFTKLYQHSLLGDTDCDGVLTYNYMAGESITHLNQGRPMLLRRPDSQFSLANFLRSQLYGTMATLKIGMEILEKEDVSIDSMTGHGGLFKTPEVGQRYMAAVCNAPVTCMETAGEGGPYGMALLVAYMMNKVQGQSLEDYLNANVFAHTAGVTLAPRQEDVEGFGRYLEQYRLGLEAERSAVNAL